MNLMLKRFCSHRRYLEIFFVIFTFVLTCFVVKQSFVKSTGTFGELNELELPIVESRQNKLKSFLKCYDRPLQFERLQYGKYWLMKNFIRGRMSIYRGCTESITYTTNGDYTFIENLETVVTRWMGPISFALFAPGYDFNGTMDAISYALNCLPQSRLIRDYVTFHIYFPNEHMPTVTVPLSEQEALEWPYDCQLAQAPYEDVQRNEMYKSKQNLTYPINVGRNIARKAANTYFIFACDIELYPSLGFIDQFLDLVANNFSAVYYEDYEKPRVFPLPVFELQSNASLPDNKEQLVKMLKKKMAIPFHMNLCKNCHMVPQQKQWLAANYTAKLEVFAVGKRHDEFAFWEPFYVSDNREPDFDERVTWEGQSNKRIQNYAMCLLDYEYHVLNPAFLVHSPGIKKFNPKSKRLHYVAPMNRVITKKILPEYAVLYGKNKKCKV